MNGKNVINPKRFSVTIADLEIERTIVAFAIAGWALKKFAPIYVMIVDLEIGKIIVANVIAG
jgi:flavoprotein